MLDPTPTADVFGQLQAIFSPDELTALLDRIDPEVIRGKLRDLYDQQQSLKSLLRAVVARERFRQRYGPVAKNGTANGAAPFKANGQGGPHP